MWFHNYNMKDNNKLHPNEDVVMQCQMQAGKIPTDLELNIDFTLPEVSVTEIMT